MAEPIAELTVKIGADTSGLENATRGVKAKLDSLQGALGGLQKEANGASSGVAALGSQVQKSGISFASLAAKIGGTVLAMVSIQKVGQALVGFFKDSVKAGLESEAAQSALNSALASTGRTVAPLSAHFRKYADELMKLTVYDDEAIQGAQALLLQLTNLDQKGIDEATKGAIGLATVFGMDLQSATRAVAMAYEGNFMAISRMIPAVRAAKTDSEKLAAVQDGLAKMFQRSQAEAGTFGGSIKQLKNAFDEIKEAVGLAVIQNEAFKSTLDAIKAAAQGAVSGGGLAAFFKIITDTPLIKGALNDIKMYAALIELQAAKAKHAENVNRGLAEAVKILGTTFSGAAPMLNELGIPLDYVINLFKCAPQKINETGNAVQKTGEKVKTLAEQLGITFRSDIEERIKKLNEALVTYRGKLTADEVKRICEEINKLSGEIKGLEKPVFDLGQSFEQAMSALNDMPLTAEEVTDDINAAFKDLAVEMQADFEKLAMKDLPAHLQNIPVVAKDAADKTATAFENAADDIAKAFGEAFATIIRDGLNFANFFKSLMQGVVNAIATMIGNQLVPIFKSLFKEIASGGKAAFEGFSDAANTAAGGIAIAFAAIWVGAAIGMLKSKAEWDDYWSEIEAEAIKAGKVINKALTVTSLKAPATPGTPSPGTPVIAGKGSWEEAVRDLEDAMKGGVKGALSLDEAWSNLISKAKELGLEGSKAFVDFILKMRESGQTSKALTEYVLGQLDTIPNALNVLTQNMIAAQDAYIKRIPEIAAAWEALKKKNPKLTDADFGDALKKGLLPDVPPEALARFKKGMDGYAQVALATFNGMIANGRSWMESLTALEGPLTDLKAQYEKLGLDVPKFLEPMFDALDIKKKHPAIFQNLDAATTILTGMRNAAYMTQASFDALAKSAAIFAKAILGVHGNLNTFLQTAKLTDTQINQLLPTVTQFVGTAAAFGLGIPAWMRTFVEKNLPGISWKEFRDRARDQANAGIATVTELRKLNPMAAGIKKEIWLNFKSYFDKDAPWVTRIVEAIQGIPATGTDTGDTGAGTGDNTAGSKKTPKTGTGRDAGPLVPLARGFAGLVPRPEYILPRSDLRALMATPTKAGGPANQPVIVQIRPIVIDKRDRYIIEFVQDNLNHGLLHVPVSAVGGN